MVEHPTSIPFKCRCGQEIDIPLADLGKPVECQCCDYVSTDVPATVTEYVGGCSQKLIRSIGGWPYVCELPNAHSLEDSIRELLTDTCVGMRTLESYLPLSTHPRQGEVQYKDYFARSCTEIPGVIAGQLLFFFAGLSTELKQTLNAAFLRSIWPSIHKLVADIIDVPHREIHFRIGRECFDDEQQAIPDLFNLIAQLRANSAEWLDVADHIEKKFRILKQPDAWRKFYDRERTKRTGADK